MIRGPLTSSPEAQSRQPRPPVSLPATAGGTKYRKLFHLLAGSILPTTALFVPGSIVLSIATAAAGVSVAGEFLRFRYEPFNRWLTSRLRPLFKEKEWSRPTASTYMLIATVIAFVAFPKPIAIVALYYLSVGDSLAAIVGGKWGHPRIFQKSLEGSLTCLLAAVLLGSLLSSTYLDLALGIVLVGAVVATVAEFVRTPIDDNLLIPLSSGTAMAVLEMAT